MKKQGLKIRAALFLVTAALASSPVLTSVAAATKKDVSSAKDKKSALEQEKKKTEEAIKSLQGLKSNTESYVKELDTKMNDLQSQVTKLENNISSKQKSIDETAVKLEEAQKTEKKQYASMKMRIKYMYEKGDSSYLNLLLEARSLSELLNRAEYVSKISEYDRKMLDQYVATKESIADSKKKLETEKAELQEMKTQTEAKQDSVQLLLNEKNKELQNVNAQIGEKSAQAKAYEDDIKAQEAKIAQMEAEIKKKEAEEAAKKAAEEAARKAAAAGKTNNSTAKGNTGSTTTTSTGSSSLRWPCPASGRITSGYGKRKSPTAGASSNHKGIDQRFDRQQHRGSRRRNGFDCNLQLFGWKLCCGQPWKWTFNRVYALFPASGIGRGYGKSRTDDREGRFDRIFDRFSSAFCSPQERKLCKPFELCKSVVRKVSGGCKR